VSSISSILAIPGALGNAMALRGESKLLVLSQIPACPELSRREQVERSPGPDASGGSKAGSKSVGHYTGSFQHDSIQMLCDSRRLAYLLADICQELHYLWMPSYIKVMPQHVYHSKLMVVVACSPGHNPPDLLQ